MKVCHQLIDKIYVLDHEMEGQKSMLAVTFVVVVVVVSFHFVSNMIHINHNWHTYYNDIVFLQWDSHGIDHNIYLHVERLQSSSRRWGLLNSSSKE